MSLRHAPPDLGEHSREIAEELGFSEEDISNFIEAGVLQGYEDPSQLASGHR